MISRPATSVLAVLIALTSPVIAHAANLENATVTEVVNNVSIIEPSTRKSSAAKVSQLFTAPSVMRTGTNSRAELVAPDRTVTRVGQNTLFSFQAASREINLQKGSILFQSPSGKGGGTINTPAASAAVLGTTLIVSTTSNGGFKVLLVEGKGMVKGKDGTQRKLSGGQMVYALPGGQISKVFNYSISQQVGSSKLIGSFKGKLPSIDKIRAEIARQEEQLLSGRLTQTTLLASGVPNYAYKVEVAQETLIDEEVNEGTDTAVSVSPLEFALNTDAFVDNPELDPAHLFTFDGGSAPFEEAPLTLEGGSSSELQGSVSSNAALFLAKSITFTTSNVNLSSFEGRSVFRFLSVDDTNFESSVSFDGLASTELHLVAGGTFNAAPGTVVSTNASHLLLASLGSGYPDDGNLDGSAFTEVAIPLQLADFGLVNTGGGLQVVSGEMNFTNILFEANTDVIALATRDLSTAPGLGFTFSVNPGLTKIPQPSKGSNVFKAGQNLVVGTGRNINMRGAWSQADRTVMKAGGAIRLQEVYIGDRSSGTNGLPGPGNPFQPTVLLRATNVVDLNRVQFFATDVMIGARTVSLRDVDFRSGSSVVLESANGLLAYGPLDPQRGSNDRPNQGQPVKFGYVNFVENVTYGGSPAENHVRTGPSNGNTGILIRKENQQSSGGFQ